MTLRNSFDELATEGTAQAAERAGSLFARQVLQYARDPQYRLRVVAESTTVSLNANGIVAVQFGANGSAPTTWWTTGAPTSMDARAQQSETSRLNMTQRIARWTF